MTVTRSKTGARIEAGVKRQADSRQQSTIVADRGTSNDGQGSPEDGISQRAYEIFCERGCEHGHDVDDWLQAERELKAPTSGSIAD